MQCSTQLLKYVEGLFFWLSVNSQFFREWNMSEKKEEERNRQWTCQLGQLAKKQRMNCHSRPLQLGSSFIPLFYAFFYFWNTKSRLLGGGGASPNFSRGKLFLLKYKAHAESWVPVILHLIQVEVFREISHWECCKCHVRASRFQNFLGGESPRPPPPPPRNSRLRREFLSADPSWNCAPPSLLLTLYGYFQRNRSRDDGLRCGEAQARY